MTEKLTLGTAPLGTKAPAFGGGAWLKTERGWQWNGGTQSPGSTFPRPGGDWDGRLIPPEQLSACWCTTCRPITPSDMRFVVCPECGNKRCPKANDHRNACTNSNEPGQPGSSWEHVMPACSNALRSQGMPYPRTCKECGLGPCKHLATLSADHPKLPEYPQSEGLNDPALEYAKNVPESWTPEEVRLWQDLQIELRNKANLRKYALELRKILDQTMSILNSQDRVYECARRLVEHADFRLGGALSADSKARDIPSNAVSQVKARHLAALRDALAGKPTQEIGALSADAQIAAHAKRLALELECLLLDTNDTAAVSKWWNSANEALAQYQADVDRLYPQDHVSPLGKD